MQRICLDKLVKWRLIHSNYVIMSAVIRRVNVNAVGDIRRRIVV